MLMPVGGSPHQPLLWLNLRETQNLSRHCAVIQAWGVEQPLCGAQRRDLRDNKTYIWAGSEGPPSLYSFLSAPNSERAEPLAGDQMTDSHLVLSLSPFHGV